MTAARKFAPALHIEKALCPRARRLREVPGKQREPCRHLVRAERLLDTLRYPARRTRIHHAVVRRERAADARRDPVDHGVRQHLVHREAVADVTIAIAPALELLREPGCEPD